MNLPSILYHDLIIYIYIILGVLSANIPNYLTRIKIFLQCIGLYIVNKVEYKVVRKTIYIYIHDK